MKYITLVDQMQALTVQVSQQFFSDKSWGICNLQGSYEQLLPAILQLIPLPLVASHVVPVLCGGEVLIGEVNATVQGIDGLNLSWLSIDGSEKT